MRLGILLAHRETDSQAAVLKNRVKACRASFGIPLAIWGLTEALINLLVHAAGMCVFRRKPDRESCVLALTTTSNFFENLNQPSRADLHYRQLCMVDCVQVACWRCKSGSIVSEKCSTLIVSADESFALNLSEYLSSYEFTVSILSSSRVAQDIDLEALYDFVITDLGIYQQESINFIRNLTAAEVQPGILMLSSYADEVERVIALELGADDIVTKSLGSREILARVRAIHRRCSRVRSLVAGNRKLADINQRFTNKDNYLGWSLNMAETTITGPNGNVILLSRAELQIIAALLKNPKTPISRDDLSTIINKTEASANVRHIDTIIARLRRKLKSGGGEVFIKTESGVGYYCK
jgi:two-component system OmpR family response regulator